MNWKLVLLFYALVTSASNEAAVLDRVEFETAQQIKFELQISDESLLTVRAMLPREQKNAMAGPLPLDRTQPTKINLGRYLPMQFIEFRNHLYALVSARPEGSRLLLDMFPTITEPDFLHKFCLWILPTISAASAADAVYAFSQGHWGQMSAQIFNCVVNGVGYGALYKLSTRKYQARIDQPKIVADDRGRPLTVSQIKRDANGNVIDAELESESGEEYRLSDVSLSQRAPLSCEPHLSGEQP